MDQILVQRSGFQHIEGNSYSFDQLEADGHVTPGSGELQAVAMVTDAVKPGLLFSYFLWGKKAANSLIHRVPDPITNAYRYKLGKAKIERLGESPWKKSLTQMTFKPRDYSGA